MPVHVRVLVLLVAAIGFLFDTYELLMFPVIGTDAVAELLFRRSFPTLTSVEQTAVTSWAGTMLWIAALCGGFFGLIGGLLIDRFGRKTIMVASILLYSLSPVAAAFSSELWMLVLFRCTTFIGVCVEMVAAVTWLAELFDNKRSREMAIGWTLAAASLGGILVTAVYKYFADYVAANNDPIVNLPFPLSADSKNLAWRYTLLTGLVPGLLILLLLPFVPESKVWKASKAAGTLKRPRLRELFAPGLLTTTLVTTCLSACSYAAAFGALQLTPLRIIDATPDLAPKLASGRKTVIAAEAKVAELNKAHAEAFQEFTKLGGTANGAKTELSPEQQAAKAKSDDLENQKDTAIRDFALAKKEFKPVADEQRALRGKIQLWQEIGGLVGRILLAVLLLFIPSRMLLRLFLIPGIVLLPVTYTVLLNQPILTFSIAIFFCGLLTVAQFSYMSEFLPKVFPVHLRGTGGGFATNFGGRMIGTMAATLNTGFLSVQFGGGAKGVATAAAVIGCAVFVIAFIATFFLPVPHEQPATLSSD